MAFHYSPKISKNDILLYYDSFNSKSYDGSDIWRSLTRSNITGNITGKNNRTSTGTLNLSDTEIIYGSTSSFNFTVDDDITFVIGFSLREYGVGSLFINGHTDGSIGFDRTTMGIRFGCRPSGDLSSITFACELDKFYIAHGVHDGSNKKIRLYVDGILIGEEDIPIGFYDNVTFKTGFEDRLIGSNAESVYMEGELSVVIIYNKVLNELEIKRNSKSLVYRNLFLDQYPFWETNNLDGSLFFSAFENDIKEFNTNETVLFGSISGSTKFRGGVLAPNGKIYCTPATFTQIMTIDTSNDSIELFGSFIGNDKWSGGALTPDGKIYCAPNNSTSVLVINTNNNTTYTVGSLGTTTFKWNDAILAPNGKIYFVPGAASEIMVIDPSDDSISYIGSFGTTGGKWNGGVLAPNGKIYCMPGVSTQILVIDTTNDTTELVGDFSAQSSPRWAGGSLAPNGKIYCCPRNANRVLEIDPLTNSGQVVGSTYALATKWFGGAVAPNGRVYFAPTNEDSVLEVNPVDGTTTLVATFPGISTYGLVLSPNGQLYFIPLSSNQVLKMGDVVNQSKNKVLSRYINTF